LWNGGRCDIIIVVVQLFHVRGFTSKMKFLNQNQSEPRVLVFSALTHIKSLNLPIASQQFPRGRAHHHSVWVGDHPRHVLLLVPLPPDFDCHIRDDHLQRPGMVTAGQQFLFFHLFLVGK
jgi:hypothetical protein